MLAEIFEDLRNSGDDHWNPCSGLPPSHEGSTNNGGDEDEDGNGNNDEDESEPEEVTPGAKGKRGDMKAKKPKTSGGQWFQEQMKQIVVLNERAVASCESIAKKEDKSDCSIRDVMSLVKSCGAVPGTDEHFTTTLVFTKRAEREMFMTLETPEERFLWLRKKHQWMTRNDVS